jgi:thiol-disulfide isomerase/thioredoxin
MGIIFYGASWCAACKPQYKAWEQAARKHGLSIEYVDVDLAQNFDDYAKIKSLPTVRVNRDKPLMICGPIKASEIDKICRGAI